MLPSHLCSVAALRRGWCAGTAAVASTSYFFLFCFRRLLKPRDRQRGQMVAMESSHSVAFAFLTQTGVNEGCRRVAPWTVGGRNQTGCYQPSSNCIMYSVWVAEKPQLFFFFLTQWYYLVLLKHTVIRTNMRLHLFDAKIGCPGNTRGWPVALSGRGRSPIIWSFFALSGDKKVWKSSGNVAKHGISLTFHHVVTDNTPLLWTHGCTLRVFKSPSICNSNVEERELLLESSSKTHLTRFERRRLAIMSRK